VSAPFIEIDGKEAAVLPLADYQALLEKAEMLDDITAYDSAKAALKDGSEERLPSDVVTALLGGGNPIRIWRKHRGLSQAQLADRVGKSQAYVAQLEAGKREGTITVYRQLAEALGVEIGDLA
jgi:DNA-binding XRE family transcriptional regulator